MLAANVHVLLVVNVQFFAIDLHVDVFDQIVRRIDFDLARTGGIHYVERCARTQGVEIASLYFAGNIFVARTDSCSESAGGARECHYQKDECSERCLHLELLN